MHYLGHFRLRQPEIGPNIFEACGLTGIRAEDETRVGHLTKLSGVLFLVLRTKRHDSVLVFNSNSINLLFEFFGISLDYFIHFFPNGPGLIDNFVLHIPAPSISSGVEISGQMIPSPEQISLNTFLTLEFAICLKFQLTI